MDVKQAIAKARSFITEIFSEEKISELRLEEVEFDKQEDVWLITFGLLRPSLRTRLGQIDEIMGTAPLKRTYKVVRVPGDENDLPSVKIRELADE